MEAYFDNSATTVVTENVKDIVVKVMTQDYGQTRKKYILHQVAQSRITLQ